MKTLLITAVASRHTEVMHALQQAGIVHFTYWDAAGIHAVSPNPASTAWLGHGTPEVPSKVYMAFVDAAQAAQWQQTLAHLTETESESRLHGSILG